MSRNLNIFGKYANHYNSTIHRFTFYFDDSKFYCIPDDVVGDDLGYIDFFRNHLQFNDRMLRFLNKDHVSSICRYIHSHMKRRKCNSMSIHEVIGLMKENVIVYIFRNKLQFNIASSYPKVSFGREYSNNNINTFDFITISFSLVRSNRTPKEIMEWINKNKKHMTNLIILCTQDRLRNRFGLSPNYLQADSIILTKDSRLVYKLSLKVKQESEE